MERFGNYVVPEPNTGCHLWTGELNSTGRPRFTVVRRSKRKRRGAIKVLASRWILQARVGPLPEGWHAHHTCESGLCVNPDHLVPMDGREHVSLHNRLDDACSKGHPRTPENTYVNPNTGHRQCRPCKRAWANARYASDPEFREAAKARAREGRG